MTMYISPDMDAEFHKWWYSPREKLRRGLADIIGLDFTTTILHNIMQGTLHVGLFHRLPQIISGIMINRGRGKSVFIIIGFTTSCGRTRIDFMGQSKKFNYDKGCEHCDADRIRSTAANQRIAQSFVSSMTGMGMYKQQDDGDEGQPVGALPPRPVKPSGGLTSWP